MKTGEKILRYLYNNGIETTFGVPSGTICPSTDSFNDFKDMKYLIPQHENTALYAACKAGKVSGKIQACLMAGAVGVTNGINAVVEAYLSGAPVIILSGYANQKGSMQDFEVHKILDNITKYNVVIKDEKDALKEVKKAMEIAMTYPKGPVHIGLPLPIQKLEYTGEDVDLVQIEEFKNDYLELNKAINAISDCSNGIIMVGGGCIGLTDKIKALAEKLNWRIITTVSGKGVIEEDYKLNLGNFGFPGTDLANNYIKRDDVQCILALGTQLGENATNNFDEVLCRRKLLIHIDVNEDVFNRTYEEDICVRADLNTTLNYLIEKIENKVLDNDIQEKLNDDYVENHTGISLRKLYETVPSILPKDTFYLNDIGSTWVYSNKYLKIPKEGDYNCNANHACMGSSVGFVGINSLDPNRTIAVFTGDGSFGMSVMAELKTAKKYNMKVVFFVNNNSELGYVSKGHQSLFGRTLRDFSSDFVDIAKLAEVFGIKSIQLKEKQDLNKLKDFLKDIDGPMLVDVITDGTEPLPTNRFKNLA